MIRAGLAAFAFALGAALAGGVDATEPINPRHGFTSKPKVHSFARPDTMKRSRPESGRRIEPHKHYLYGESVTHSHPGGTQKGYGPGATAAEEILNEYKNPPPPRPGSDEVWRWNLDQPTE